MGRGAMPIEYSERWSERKLSVSTGKDGVNDWTATRVWDVVGTSSETDALNAVLDAAKNAPHDRNPALRVKTRTTDFVGLEFIKLTANYTIPADGSDGDKGDREGEGGDGGPSFTNVPALYMMNEQEEAETTDRDVNGAPIVNSAGEAFDGGATFPLKTFLYTVTLRQPYFDVNQASNYFNTLNESTFTTPFGSFQKGEVLFSSVVPTEPFMKKAKWVTCVYSFKIRLRANFPNMPADASPWDRRFLDKGVNAFAAGNAGKVLGAIYGKGGEKVSRDVRLNGRGIPVEDGYYVIGKNGKREPGKAGEEPKAPKIEHSNAAGVKAVFLWYPVYRTKSFSDLNLGF